MVRDASGDARGGRQGRWRRLPLHVERLSRGQWLEVPAWMFDRARCLDPSPLTASPFVSMDALRSSAAGIEAAAVIIECAAFWRIQILSRAESGSAVRLKRPVSFTSPCYDRRCYNSRIASPPQKLHRSPFPGNGISRPETKAPKRPPRFNCPFAETEWSPRTPPIGGYSPVAGKSPFAMVSGLLPQNGAFSEARPRLYRLQ